MRYQLLIIVLFGLSLLPIGAGSSASNISGTWAGSINLEGGPQNVAATFVFKQEGEKLTGTVSRGFGEGGKVTGTVKGDKVAFSVEAKTRSGESVKFTYTGMIESTTKMTGALEFPKGPGKWTATKQ
jgi:hypothetical protein